MTQEQNADEIILRAERSGTEAELLKECADLMAEIPGRIAAWQQPRAVMVAAVDAYPGPDGKYSAHFALAGDLEGLEELAVSVLNKLRGAIERAPSGPA